MKKKSLFLSIQIAFIIVMMSTLAFAAENGSSLMFSDVPENASYYEAVTYAAENHITNGTGGGRFSPNQTITALQWNTLLCRAFHFNTDTTDPMQITKDRARYPTASGYGSNSSISYKDLCTSAFRAFEVPTYNIYGQADPFDADSCYYAAVAYGICDDGVQKERPITRAEAVQILYVFMTQRERFEHASILQQVHLLNTDHADLLPYISELKLVPERILEEFERQGWQYHIDSKYVEERGLANGTAHCVGLTTIGKNIISVKAASSTLHEFGHFLYYALGKPETVKEIYEAEGKSCGSILRPYSEKNASEFFADFFRYWLKGGTLVAAEDLENCFPRTCLYFSLLSEKDWLMVKERNR